MCRHCMGSSEFFPFRCRSTPQTLPRNPLGRRLVLYLLHTRPRFSTSLYSKDIPCKNHPSVLSTSLRRKAPQQDPSTTSSSGHTHPAPLLNGTSPSPHASPERTLTVVLNRRRTPSTLDSSYHQKSDHRLRKTGVLCSKSGTDDSTDAILPLVPEDTDTLPEGPDTLTGDSTPRFTYPTDTDRVQGKGPPVPVSSWEQ